jgi:phenylacetic acid degradation operon negative regulatory protein
VQLDLGISTSRGNSLVTDISALYLHGGPDTWMATSGWMACLGALDVVDAAARTALHRMSRGGYLAREPRGGVAGYAMSPGWRRLMDSVPGSEDPRWLLVTFTVPEDRRGERHQLRTVLSRAGLGSLGNGVWVGSTAREEQLMRVLQGGGLDGYVELFTGDHIGFGSDVDLAHRCWDLPALAADGHALVERLDALASEPADGPAAFARWVDANNAARLHVSRCPQLPVAAQPDDWPLDHVTEALARLGRRLQPQAQRWFDSVRHGRAAPQP